MWLDIKLSDRKVYPVIFTVYIHPLTRGLPDLSFFFIILIVSAEFILPTKIYSVFGISALFI